MLTLRQIGIGVVDTVEKIREVVDKLVTRVSKLEVDTALLLRGHEEHMTRMTDFIRRFERSRDDDVRKNETFDREDKEYKKEMRGQVTKLVTNSDQLEGMKSLVKIQWAAAIGFGGFVTLGILIFVTFHH